MMNAIEAAKQINELIAKQDVAAVINEFKSRIEGEVKFDKVVLFGSRARGDHKLDSDIDIAVVISNPPASRQEKREITKKLLKVTFDIELKTGLVINPLIISKSEYTNSKDTSILVRNIINDGVDIR